MNTKSAGLLTALGLSMALAAPAMAQGTGANQNGSQNQTAPQSSGQSSANAGADAGALRQQVQHDLEQSGFTNVQVMPRSFLVRATDKQGRPVMMLINPDSVVELTSVPGASNGSGNNGASNSGTTHNSNNGAAAGGNSTTK